MAHRHLRLCRMAYLLARDWGTAEDLVQTALAKAWVAWRRIEGNPDPYVYRIIVNTHATWWRRLWRGEQPVEALPETADPHDHAAAVDDQAALWNGNCIDHGPCGRALLVARDVGKAMSDRG
ncbi:sigma factor [Nonomuraea sp. B1E8]|uniref:sigma factor n=1 Tax=unclassified Nonomuraea TaxID=2593643 RepID=UPI00325D5709